jgi:hypothetical protein
MDRYTMRKMILSRLSIKSISSKQYLKLTYLMKLKTYTLGF